MHRLRIGCAVLAAACGGGSGGGPDAEPPDAPPPGVSAAPAPDLLPAADPKMEGFDGWPVRFTVETAGRTGITCHIEITKSGTLVQDFDEAPPDASGVCGVTWYALDSLGIWLRVGPVVATVHV